LVDAKPVTTASGRAGDWLALLAIAAVWVGAWVAVDVRADVPVIDDWVYAWSVEHLLATGRLKVLEFSAIYPIAEAAWGALFARVAGLSFVVLRCSTVVLSVVACWSVYLTLRELNARRSTALLGALGLALHPVYFALSFTFMTEVPFIAFSSVAVYCYVCALRRDSVAPLWAGGGFAVLAFLVRPVGIVVPLAAVVALLWGLDWRRPDAWRRVFTNGSFWRPALPILTTLAVMVALQLSLPWMLGPLEWAAIRASWLRDWFSVPLVDYGRWTLTLFSIAAFPLLPLLLAFVARRRRAVHVLVAAVLWAVACRVALGEVSMPLPNWQTWSLQEISARTLIGGDVSPSLWSARMAPLVKVLGAICVAALCFACLDAWRRRSGRGEGELVVLSLGVLHLGAIHALWFYNDRYYVVLAPVLAMIAALALDANRRGRWLAAVLLVFWAGIDITGTRDMLAFNEACADAVQQLEAQGIPPSDIDAGYSQNGWRLYAHPENLPPGATRGEDVPYVTSKDAKPYRITNSPQPGTDILRVVPLKRATWQASREIYVLRATEAAK
jgi:hypothetical protein